MKQLGNIGLSLIIAASISITAINCGTGNPALSGKVADEGRPPVISPDYTGIVIPSTIAPLNFQIRESGTSYHVGYYTDNGDSLTLGSKSSSIEIPYRQWREFLAENRGKTIRIVVSVQDGNNCWKRFAPFTQTVSDDDIDSYIMYRRLKPLHNYWRTMRIAQRNITSFDESTVFGNEGIDSGCCNCHMPRGGSSDTMLIHTRSSFGTGMLLVKDGTVTGINSRTPFGAPIAYSSWHPDGDLIAFSVNRVKQYFHTAGDEVREVVDLDSSLGVYSVKNNTLLDVSPEIQKYERLETYPMWSADGRYLYYCSAPLPWTEEEKNAADKDITLPPGYKTIRYDLMRIGYDSASNTWGMPETILSAEETGKSITQPRPSPDGRFLLFCMADYGCFPTYQQSSDIYMMNIATGEYTPLSCNSDRCDSWHSWSGNGRWIVFSSKRIDGIFARPYFVHCDSDGAIGKAFILPQKDPATYDSLLDTFNVPEFANKPVAVDSRSLAKANKELAKINGIDVAVTAATPKATPEPEPQKRQQ